MNLNNTKFDNAMPIIIKAARQVSEILKYIPGIYVHLISFIFPLSN